MVWVVLATGPSLNQSIADSVRGHNVVAVSDAYRLAPWADALASTDSAWWKQHPEALAFSGLKFGAMPDFRAIHGVERLHVDTGTNSGLLGIMVAVKLGARRVLLCGFDLKDPGNHFFGKHPKPLKSTKPERMEAFKRQFKNYQPRGVQIINCTPDSALDVYPRAALEDCLAESPVHGS
ncbi:hypothetical protein X551_03935 [Methylibium sp. T29]|uniref:hypothetical protein n=1 Tax=Methylibium sp. T29-B TaxID=1437443 RepID=UPI0003F42000|nr:hypothetical protein [Methylibium sp. T29-B]EWS53278.1 hypothetical protein X551_03935 [Methylibium sp. T29]EWS58519.1 hypothetical protein Y694_03615 [Methylibium sp. T29-B]